MKVGIFCAIFMAAILLPAAHVKADLLRDFFDDISAVQVEEETSAERNIITYPATNTDKMMIGIHNEGPTADMIARDANLVNGIARRLNAKTAGDMLIGGLDAENGFLRSRVEAVCPVEPVDCSTKDLTFRPITNICNNLQKPTLGNTNIAQKRLARAFWENAGSITVRTQVPNRLRPLDRRGIRFFNQLVFHVRGTSSVRLTILSPEERCVTVFISNYYSTVQKELPGVITSAVPTGYSEYYCVEGYNFEYEENILTVSDVCTGSFSVCYQPPHIELTLAKNAGEECTLSVDGQVVHRSRNSAQLFPDTRSVPFWIRDTRGAIQVGQGSECNDQSVFMTAQSPFADLSLKLSLLKFSVALSQLASGTAQLECPVRDAVVLRTNFRRTQNLDDFPFLVAQGTLRYGVAVNLLYTSSYTLQLTDTTNDIMIEVCIDRFSTVSYSQGGVVKGRNFLDSSLLQNLPSFEDGSETTHSGFGAIWISWVRQKIYIGAGNMIGENKLALPLQMNLPFELTIDQAVLSSSRDARWIFDLVQFGVPRQTSFTGNKLPTARDVSLLVHTNLGQSTQLSSRLTMAVMNFGQFVDHDIVATPVETFFGQMPVCCVDGQPIENPSQFCFNIEITDKKGPDGTQGQFPFPEHQCLPLVRSSAALECGPMQDLRNREQLNAVTSFVDGSNIYGSTDELATTLRAGPFHTGAFLETSLGGNELPQIPNGAGAEECRNEEDPTQLCFEAGDFRSGEQPGLTGMHSLWVREHNRVTQAFIDAGYPVGTAEEREYLYQIVRRIVSAEYSNVVYNGYLKSFMDDGIFNDFGLGPGGCTYNSSIDPSGLNEWGIANRMGHTWIRPTLEGNNLPLVEHFFRPSLIHERGSDFLQRNLFLERCPNTDRILETVVTEDLFRAGPDALDLASLNIQRGRDHGVSYCRLREALGLPVPSSFQAAVKMGLFSSDTSTLLQSCYECICDIDLFTGIVAEQPLAEAYPTSSDSPNGQTLNFIMATFFRNAKCGDRYFYEFPAAGFTKAQIDSIQTVTLSSILCANTEEVTTIQPDAFNIPSSSNQAVSCSEIPTLDLSLFYTSYRRRTLQTDENQKENIQEEKQVNAELNQELEKLLEILNEENKIAK